MAENHDSLEVVPPSPVATSTQMSQSRVAFPRLPRLPSLDIDLDQTRGEISLSPIPSVSTSLQPIGHSGRNQLSARSPSGPNLQNWIIRPSQQPVQHISTEGNAESGDDDNDDGSSTHSSVTIVDSSSENEVVLVSDSDSEIELRRFTTTDDDDDNDDGVSNDAAGNDDTLVDRPVGGEASQDREGGLSQQPVPVTAQVEPRASEQMDPQGEGQVGGSATAALEPGTGTLQLDSSTSTHPHAGETVPEGTHMSATGADSQVQASMEPPEGIAATPGPSATTVRLLAAQGESPAEFRSPKRKRVHSPESSSAVTAGNNKEDEEDDGDSCPICFEPWTTSGNHRLSCLRCGHLFGQSCIEKWLKGQGGKCPQCNAKAKRQDIRVLYAKAFKVLDTSERDRALKDLEKEREVRKRAEMEGAQLRLQYQMAIEENNRLQLEVQTLKLQLRKPGGAIDTTGTKNPTVPVSQSAVAGQFALDRTIKICQAGNCRVIAYCTPLASLVASAPSSNPLFPGFGIKMINTLDFGNTQFYTIHSKPIRDLAFHPTVDDGMLLSCGLDKKVKMTSLLSGAVVQTYDTPMPAWSCVWNAENSNFFYAGLQNGDVLEYDVRNTEEAVRTLNGDKRSPVASLCYLSQDMGAEFRPSGLLVGQLDRVSFFENLQNQEHRIHILPLEGSLTSLQVEPNTRHILASFRPTGNHPTVRHQLCKLISRNISADPTVIDNVCSCNVIHTFHGGRTQTVLSKNSVIPHPADASRLLVCGGDEPNKSVHIWDSATGQMCQRIVTGDFTIDLCSYKSNNSTYLAALSDKQCRLFKYT